MTTHTLQTTAKHPEQLELDFPPALEDDFLEDEEYIRALALDIEARHPRPSRFPMEVSR